MEEARIDVTAHVKAYLEGFSAAFQLANEMLEAEIAKGEAEAPAQEDKVIDPDVEMAKWIKRLRAKNLI
ncbi:hypothetical protein [Agrobacterium tumefaciens]|uniref:hypothetical protein n=1 Tax=Agrobacterium tumefaciens TaxID=358 RepID=UPI002244B042|nr:hypothetical protein [Agrobacterium tumefaciens]MCW8057665.1 hypothetical protein [Agrobacterium tumefaciens]MCW8146945.1 hypothetical protein [Agrobacterium tumefaciens]